MRPSQKGRNARGKSGRKPVGNVVNRVYESAGPEGKVRGTPQQIVDKYLLLARDAQTAGDRVLAESFLQHAEHYIRLLNTAYQQAEERRQQNQPQNDDSGASDSQPADESASSAREDAAEAASEADRPNTGAGGGLETIESADESVSGPVETPESAGEPASAEQPDDKPKKNGDGRRRRRKPVAADQGGESDEAHAG